MLSFYQYFENWSSQNLKFGRWFYEFMDKAGDKKISWAYSGSGGAYTYHAHVTGCPRHVIFSGWALGPPVWFLLEYGLLFDADKEDLNTFRHYQSLCRNLWLGFLAYLAAFYLGRWN